MSAPTLTFSPAMFHAAVVKRIKAVTRRHIPGVHHEAVTNVRLEKDVRKGRIPARGIGTLATGTTFDFGPPAHLPGEVKPAVTAWAVSHIFDSNKPKDLRSANGSSANGKPLPIWFNDGTPKPAWAGKTRPARFFPGHLYTLAPQIRILDARPEWLYDITEADALLEGIQMFHTPEEGNRASGYSWSHDSPRYALPATAYFNLWDTLHGPGHAATNPLVWRYEFEMIL